MRRLPHAFQKLLEHNCIVALKVFGGKHERQLPALAGDVIELRQGLRRLRLDEGRRRLHTRAGGIQRVAISVGFRSADAFRRAFEKQFGINPSEYRARFLTSTL